MFIIYFEQTQSTMRQITSSTSATSSTYTNCSTYTTSICYNIYCYYQEYIYYLDAPLLTLLTQTQDRSLHRQCTNVVMVTDKRSECWKKNAAMQLAETVIHCKYNLRIFLSTANIQSVYKFLQIYNTLSVTEYQIIRNDLM